VLPRNAICRIGLIYDGSYFSFERRYFYHEGKLVGSCSRPSTSSSRTSCGRRNRASLTYKVVYPAWFQGLFQANDATEEQLRFERSKLRHGEVGNGQRSGRNYELDLNLKRS
jgi:hypothetical protein